MIAATVDGVRVVCAYVPNGQSVDSDKYQYKLRWCAAAEEYLRDTLARHRDVAFVGDLNIAPEPRDVHDPARGRARCCSRRRSARPSRAGSASGLEDTLPLVRAAAEDVHRGGTTGCSRSRRTTGLRIDHVLASRVARRTLHVVHDRPQRAQGREAVRPRAGRRRVRGLGPAATARRSRPDRCPSRNSRADLQSVSARCLPAAFGALAGVVLFFPRLRSAPRRSGVLDVADGGRSRDRVPRLAVLPRRAVAMAAGRDPQLRPRDRQRDPVHRLDPARGVRGQAPVARRCPSRSSTSALWALACFALQGFFGGCSPRSRRSGPSSATRSRCCSS